VQIIFTVSGIEGELLRGLCNHFVKPPSGKTNPVGLKVDFGTGRLEYFLSMVIKYLNPYAF
jgi:hypothetical protein